jgi:hypothetical protein
VEAVLARAREAAAEAAAEATREATAVAERRMGEAEQAMQSLFAEQHRELLDSLATGKAW